MAIETEIGGLIRSGKNDEAMVKIVRLLKKNDGNLVHASNAIGVHHATLKRWIAALDEAGVPIRQALLEIRVDAGSKASKPKAGRTRQTA
jgi:L-ascorbate metabolism protein UlaG (beta-lactamase superfamily)